MVNLDEFLRVQGTNTAGFPLSTPTAISADGKRIGGWSPFQFKSWIVDMPKVVITHAPPGRPENAKTIVIDSADLDAHLAHGDTVGITYSNN